MTLILAISITEIATVSPNPRSSTSKGRGPYPGPRDPYPNPRVFVSKVRTPDRRVAIPAWSMRTFELTLAISVSEIPAVSLTRHTSASASQDGESCYI